MNESIKLMARNKVTLLMLSLTLIVGGISAQAAGILNSETGGYLVCVNSKTKVITHPGKTICPKGSKKIVLGAQGSPGLTGATGLSGKDGRDGLDGKTLWNGVKDPENSWGAPGDMFINSVTKTLFGPKNLDGTWPVGVSMIGPQGERGPIGLTGATGAQGPSGPAGATGAQGPQGATGAQGPAGSQGPQGETGEAGSQASLTCAQGGTCQIGDTGPGGGKVFYVQTPTAAAPWRYLEAAPETWFNGTTDPQMTWCSDTVGYLASIRDGNTALPTKSSIGSGYANTQIMLKNCAYGAANVAASYNGGGKSDWFLPSIDELHKLYVEEIMGGIGSGGDNNYWSSSEYGPNDNQAWEQSFLGPSNANNKSFIFYVRPVRAF